MSNVLVVEDVDESYLLIQFALGDQYSLTRAKTLSEAMSAYAENFDLILADIGLPDGDGFQFCDWVRSKMKNQRIPILFLTASTTTESRITGFSLGADDFISKPFSSVELRVRIDARLRRVQPISDLVQEIGGIQLDLRSQVVRVQGDRGSHEIDLTPHEFKILNVLINERERALTRDEILNKVWGTEVFVYPRSVDTHISKLRAKLGSRGSYIKSVHGVGYKFHFDTRFNQAPGSVLPSSIVNVV